MISTRNSRFAVWLVATCATLVAQVAPQAACRACDQSCCARQADHHAAAATDSLGDTAVACPHCLAAARVPPAEPNDHPCRCQLDSRHDQAAAVSRGSVRVCADGEPAAPPTAAVPLVPQALGVSREYLAASLAVPIRPPRILFGVWRN